MAKKYDKMQKDIAKGLMKELDKADKGNIMDIGFSIITASQRGFISKEDESKLKDKFRKKMKEVL